MRLIASAVATMSVSRRAKTSAWIPVGQFHDVFKKESQVPVRQIVSL
jgi:hypothetical protein